MSATDKIDQLSRGNELKGIDSNELSVKLMNRSAQRISDEINDNILSNSFITATDPKFYFPGAVDVLVKNLYKYNYKLSGENLFKRYKIKLPLRKGKTGVYPFLVPFKGIPSHAIELLVQSFIGENVWGFTSWERKREFASMFSLSDSSRLHDVLQDEILSFDRIFISGNDKLAVINELERKVSFVSDYCDAVRKFSTGKINKLGLEGIKNIWIGMDDFLREIEADFPDFSSYVFEMRCHLILTLVYEDPKGSEELIYQFVDFIKSEFSKYGMVQQRIRTLYFNTILEIFKFPKQMKKEFYLELADICFYHFDEHMVSSMKIESFKTSLLMYIDTVYRNKKYTRVSTFNSSFNLRFNDLVGALKSIYLF